MTKKLLWLDGFSSRQYNGEWPGGAYGETIYGNPGADVANRENNYSNGRFYGQAGGGRYASWFGGWANFAPKDRSTFGTFDWFQAGFWLQWNDQIDDDAGWRLDRYPMRMHMSISRG